MFHEPASEAEAEGRLHSSLQKSSRGCEAPFVPPGGLLGPAICAESRASHLAV